MKKITAFMLVLLMGLSGVITAFAESTDTIPADVKGTNYESAVRALMEKGIVSGYNDSTFRPENNMDRAEACATVVKAMNPLGADLFHSTENKFSDMDGYDWALEYVNYAANKGIVSGQLDDTFHPSGNISYNEMAAMLINAMGYTAKDLPGVWPANYVAKAKELGIFNGSILLKDGNSPASRGDVAIMTATVVDKIASANKDRQPVVMPISTSGAIDNGQLNGYTGRVYGMILSTEKTADSEGRQVDQINFLLGNAIYHLTTDGKAAIPAEINYLSTAGDLYCMKMNKGIVTKIGIDSTILNSDLFQECTSSKSFEIIKTRTANEAVTGQSSIKLMDDTIIYIAQFKDGKIAGYKAGGAGDIKEGCAIRAFDLTGNKMNLADVAIIVEASDAAKL